MGKDFKIVGIFFLLNILLLAVVVPALRNTGIFQSRGQGVIYYPPGLVVTPIWSNPATDSKNTLQLYTIPFATGIPPTATPLPTRIPTAPVGAQPTTGSGPQPTQGAGGPIPITKPQIGGPASSSDPFYCMDDQDPDMCDDNSSYHVPKGSGGLTGSCGTVIEQTHKLVAALPQYMKGLRDKLTTTVSNCNYSTGPASGYVSTFLVIDAYNLAGFKELSKSNASHVSPSGLFSWWQSAPAGYKFIPYSSAVIQQYGSGQQNLTGCVMFLKTSSYHIGIVNALELYTANGDGVISILQAGTKMYIDRFPVVGWNVKNTSTNQTSTSGVAGFGCRS